MIHRRDVVNTEDLFFCHMAKHRNLGLRRRVYWLIDEHATGDQIGRESQASQVAHCGLSGLCLLLAMHIRNQRNMDKSKIAVPDPELELSHCFDKRGGFNITDSTTKLDITSEYSE
jgi:hypothetical protein